MVWGPEGKICRISKSLRKIAAQKVRMLPEYGRGGPSVITMHNIKCLIAAEEDPVTVNS